ncbi:MAG: 2-dehydropantoate 2-reductase [Myxococcota bacterium]
MSEGQQGDGVLVFGAGAIGGYVGASLAAAGVPVALVGRRWLLHAARGGIRLTDFAGRDAEVASQDLALLERPPPALPRVVLLTVKSKDTRAAAETLAPALPKDGVVVSLQNGVGNPETLRAVLGAERVAAGMVPFNVVLTETKGGGLRFHRGTSGELAVEPHPALAVLYDAFRDAGLPLELHEEFAPVAWGKLFLNLNNAVNALDGRPLARQLRDRASRRVLAAMQRELLAALAAAGIAPVTFTPVPLKHVPRLLSLPTPLFTRVAKRMITIDPEARSSMADDLARGRKTEVDALQGAVVRLADAHGTRAPVCAAVAARVAQAEAAGAGSPRLEGRELARRVLG